MKIAQIREKNDCIIYNKAENGAKKSDAMYAGKKSCILSCCCRLAKRFTRISTVDS